MSDEADLDDFRCLRDIAAAKLSMPCQCYETPPLKWRLLDSSERPQCCESDGKATQFGAVQKRQHPGC